MQAHSSVFITNIFKCKTPSLQGANTNKTGRYGVREGCALSAFQVSGFKFQVKG